MTAQLAHSPSLADKVLGGARRRRLALGAVALAAAVGAGVAGNGATAQAATTANGAQAASAKHCVADVGAPGDARCFGTFRAAIRFATDGRVTTAPASAAAGVADKGLTAKLDQPGRQAPRSQAPGSYIVGIMYEHINFGGASFTWTANRGCTDTIADVDFWVTSMPAGWNDVVSSL